MKWFDKVERKLGICNPEFDALHGYRKHYWKCDRIGGSGIL